MHRPELAEFLKVWKTIRNEMLKINSKDESVSRPKCDYDELDPEVIQKMLECEAWSYIQDTDKKWWNFPLFTWGEPTGPALKLAPRTVEILKKIGGIHFAGFSLLEPDGVISPHFDDVACPGSIGELTYHLGLVCPTGCYFLQEGRIIEEDDGKLFNFICHKKHAAINLSAKRRVILYMTFTK